MRGRRLRRWTPRPRAASTIRCRRSRWWCAHTASASSSTGGAFNPPSNPPSAAARRIAPALLKHTALYARREPSSSYTDANRACNEAESSVERFCHRRSFLQKHSKEDPKTSRCNSPASRSTSRAQTHPNPSRTQSRMSHSSQRPTGGGGAHAPPRTKGAAIIRDAAPDPRSYVMRNIAPTAPSSSRVGERSQSRSSVQTLGYAASRTASRTTSRRTSYME
jgi:hypothetical protein